MTSIFEINDWSHVASFFIWTLAVCAIAKALFGSLPAAEFQYRLALRDQPKRQHMTRLNWEINHRARWDAGSEDMARGSPHAAAAALTDDELEAKRRELQRLLHTSLPWRALQYLLGCWACQTFWTAALIYAVTAGITAPGAWFFSAAAYCGAAVLLLPTTGGGGSRRAAAASSHTEPATAQGGCRGCGK